MNLRFYFQLRAKNLDENNLNKTPVKSVKNVLDANGLPRLNVFLIASSIYYYQSKLINQSHKYLLS